MRTAVISARKARAPEKACSPSRLRPQTAPGLPRMPRSGRLSGAPCIAAWNRSTFEESDDQPVACAGPVPAWKRIQDIGCILISLPLTLPLMAAIALWIKAVSRGPALFRQERIGRGGKRFVLYKFRSMTMHADTRRHTNHFRHLVHSDKPMVKLDLLRDPRLIPGGCLLRAAGLDELPQLLNVLRGEMSLVGPRPCLTEEFCFFSPRQKVRFEVLPGLTGIWQVHGKGLSTFGEMNALDTLYVRRFSPSMDLGIILRTPIVLLRQLHQAFQQQWAAGRTRGSELSEEVPLSGYKTQQLG